jgi:hypothetical protein
MSLRLSLALVVFSTLLGCKPDKPPEPQAIHVVLCWLKQPGDATDRKLLIDTSRSFLGQIPGLLDVQTGKVLETARPGADSTFDMAVVFTFQNEKALRAYDTNPTHQAALRDVLKPRAQKILIYDFIDELPSNRVRKEAKPFTLVK